MNPVPFRIRLAALFTLLFATILAAAYGAALLMGWRIEWGTAPWWRLGLAAAATLAALVAAADLLLRRRVLGPLGRMARRAGRIADGEYDLRVEESGPEEVRFLAEGINRLADALLEDRRKLAENVESLQEVNRALTETRDELIQAEKLASVGRMAAGLAHEIGNPLNSVLTYVEVGRRRGADGEWLEGIEEEARRIDGIVQGLLDFARPGEPMVDRHEVNAIVRESLDLLESQGRLGVVEVETSLEEELPDVWVSPMRLQQVLVNLLLNAVDAMESELAESARQTVTVRSRRETYRGPSGVEERRRRSDDPEEVDYSHLRRFHQDPSPVLDHGLEPGDPIVAVEVLDTGPGLDAEPPERVFDPFYTTKEPGRGTGLGLAVSARLVSRMGGTMSAENRSDGTGACFRVLLPTSRPPEVAGEEDPRPDEAEERSVEEKSEEKSVGAASREGREG